MSANRREVARARLLKRGQIVFNGGFTTVDCIVLDVSPGGAKLKFPPWVAIPDRFELRVDEMPPRRAEVRHRGPDAVGILFLD